MDGFLRSGDNDVFSIGYYDGGRPGVHPARGAGVHDLRPLPLLAAGARRSPTASTCTRRSPTGTSDNSLPADAVPTGFPDTTIFAALDAGGRLEPLLLHRPAGRGAVGRARPGALGPRRRSTTQRCATGTLPPSRFVDPSFAQRGRRAPPATSTRTATCAPARRSWPTSCTRSWSRRSGSAARCSSSTTSGAASSTTSRPPRVPDDPQRPRHQQGLRADGLPHPGASRSRRTSRRGHVDHTIYGFESILKMIQLPLRARRR